MAAPSTVSNVSMLQIDYPPSATEIRDRTLVPYKGVPLPEESPEWVQLWIGRQKQAENDMALLYNSVVDVNTRATMAFTNVEATYDQLHEGTKFLYDMVENTKQQTRAEIEKRMVELAGLSRSLPTR